MNDSGLNPCAMLEWTVNASIGMPAPAQARVPLAGGLDSAKAIASGNRIQAFNSVYLLTRGIEGGMRPLRNHGRQAVF